MNKKVSTLAKAFVLATLLSLTACETSDINSVKNSTLASEHRYNLDELNKRETGLVSVSFSDQTLFKDEVLKLKKSTRKKVTPGSNAFDINAIDFSSPAVSKLALEVKAGEIEKPVSKTINWKPGETASFSLPVKAGKNRIITLYALDDGNRVLGTLKGALNVVAGQNNTGEISYFETVVAQTLHGALFLNGVDLLNKIDLAELRAYLLKVTGYNKENNTYSAIPPSELNTSAIVNEIFFNEGGMPEEGGVIEQSELKTTGSVTVDLEFTGARLILSDLNSEVVESTTELQTVINNVTLGEWQLTVLKEGYVPQTYMVNVTDIGSLFQFDPEIDKRAATFFHDSEFEAVYDEIVNEENGYKIKDLVFQLGKDNGDGAVNEFGDALVSVDGFDEHGINFEQVNYPVMSNMQDSVFIHDKVTGKTLHLISDQELQTFGIYSDNQSFFVSTNFDGTWTFKETTVDTTDKLAELMLNDPLFKDVSIHTLAFMYELFTFDWNRQYQVKTLVPINCSSGLDANVSNYNSYELMTQLFKDAYLVMKEKG